MLILMSFGLRHLQTSINDSTADENSGIGNTGNLLGAKKIVHPIIS